MRWHRSGRELWVELLGDFNYERVLKLKEILKDDDILILNLHRSSFVDTEAVDFLYNLKLKGREFKLLNSPYLLKRVCEMLKVTDLPGLSTDFKRSLSVKSLSIWNSSKNSGIKS